MTNAAEESEAAPGNTRVEITVAGHTVICEAPEPLEAVAAKALQLFQTTAGAASRLPMGFDSGSTGVIERAAPFQVQQGLDPWQEG